MWNDAKTGTRQYAKARLFEMFHNPFYAGWVVSERFGIQESKIPGNWEPVITYEEYLKGLEILKKHDLDKSRDRRYFYLLKGLLWMDLEGVQYKMAGSSPKTRLRMYPYYTTQVKPGGKDINIQCEQVDSQIQVWLSGIAIDPQRLPAIREEYQRQVTQYHESERKDQTQKIQAQLSQLKGEEARLGRLYITEKISEETYTHLRTEWQENLRNIESRLLEAERNINAMLVDLDIALLLLSKIDLLYPRLDEKSQGKLLKILAKKIIINREGLITGHEIHSPFTYLRSLAEEDGNTSSPYRDSEQVRSGAPDRTCPEQLSDTGQFIDQIRFEERSKLCQPRSRTPACLHELWEDRIFGRRRTGAINPRRQPAKQLQRARALAAASRPLPCLPAYPTGITSCWLKLTELLSSYAQ